MRILESLLKSSTFHRVGLMAAVGVVLLVGCSTSVPTGSLKGKAAFDGKPVTNARVLLQSSKTGRAAAADIDANGEFKFPEPIEAGEYGVSITPVFDAPAAGEEGDGASPPERPDIPAKYRDITTSGLTITITEGSNTLDVEMSE